VSASSSAPAPLTPAVGRQVRVTEGSLLRAIAALAAPMFFSALLSNAQSLIDLFWVGRLGHEAIAAVAMGGTVVWVLSPMLMGLSTGTVALVARAVGARRREDAAAAAGQSLLLAAFFGAGTAVLGTVYADRLIALLGAAPEVQAAGGGYLRIMLWGSFSVFFLFISNAGMQGAGDPITPMRLMLLANAINIVLDPILIFGLGPTPRLGVVGAGWATLIADATAAAFALRALAGGRAALHVRPADLRPQGGIIWRLLRIGIPGSGQMLARSLMTAALMRVVAGFGTVAVAAYGTGMRFHMIVLMPAFALGGAAATIVGQNLGAGRPDRAQRGAWLASAIGVGFMVASGLVLVLFAPALIRAFNPAPEVVAIGAVYLRTVSPFYIFAALAIVLGRGLNGAGDSLFPMLFTVASLWGLQVPLAVTLSRPTAFGLPGVWWAMAAATAVHGLLVTGWFLTGRWKRARI